MSKILINRGNVINAKSYPFWDELNLKDHEVKEIKGILSSQELIDLVNWCDTWVSIDSFLPHFCAYHKLKPGIVLWGTSDPLIFGYKHNTNLLKNRKYLRNEQFKWWKDEVNNPDTFLSTDTILQSIEKMLK